MVEAIDLTLSDDESNNEAQPLPTQLQPEPTTSVTVKYEQEGQYQPAAAAAAATANNDAAGIVLKPAITGGKGLWSLWTRNFKSTLLMILDLVDNSVDAALPRGQTDFTGRVQIYRDLYEVVPGQTYTTGLCIRNNSPQNITPLKNVLRLFISNKEHSGCTSIGENGVGLKQSCAALSDLSFVLVKNGTILELGILAKALQKVDGCYLPCFEFQVEDDETVGQQMMELFLKPSYKEVADCIAQYGKVRSGGRPSLARGIARLSKRFEEIDANFYDNDHVFEVIIDKVVHHGNSDAIVSEGKNTAVSEIINELQHEVSRRYLHIPAEDSFKFCVGKKTLNFNYWPERMVEFTRIEIPVRSRLPWHEDFGENTPDSYFLRVLLGFDRFRISDPESGVKKSKACSLYIYSRTSGRLIQYEQDARTMLGLTAGGTDYCQGLTIIIDDPEGHLPLDPTKQGIAFGNQAFGNVHEENLYAVVRGVAKFYYNYHKNKFGGKKTVLTQKILEFADRETPDNLKACCNSKYTDYGLRFNLTKDNQIMVDHTCYEDEIIGPDTIFRLVPEGEVHIDKVNEPTRSPIKRPKRSIVSKLYDKPKQSRSRAGATSPKRRPRRKAPTTPSKKKQPAAKVTPSPSTKKPARNARVSPPKKKQAAETRLLPAKRRQQDADIDRHKKQSVPKTTSLPPRRKGLRSSSRLSRSKPASYNDYSDAESDDDTSRDGSESDGVENEAPESETTNNDENLIDLCASSDDEEEMINAEAPVPVNILSNSSSVNESRDIDVAEESAEKSDIDEYEDVSTEVKSLKAENTGLKSENANLKARVSALETENASLEKEIEKLRAELEQSKRTISVIKRRTGEKDIH